MEALHDGQAAARALPRGVLDVKLAFAKAHYTAEAQPAGPV